MDDLNGIDNLDKKLLANLGICNHEYHEVKRYVFKGTVFIVWRCVACTDRTVSRKP